MKRPGGFSAVLGSVLAGALGCGALGYGVTGCSASDVPLEETSGAPAEAASAPLQISYGSEDTTRTAVMALINIQAGACSGTVIAAEPPWGYLLTAAHCVVAVNQQGGIIQPVRDVSPDVLVVVPSNDYLEGLEMTTWYPVQAFQRHTGYDGQTANPNDVAVVRFYGADANTPVIPRILVNEDDIVQGSMLRYVGYGQTDDDDMNATRHSVVRPATNPLTDEFISHSRQGGGICLGDSGGPALFSVGNAERVAGVSSFSEGVACASNSGTGVAVRVSNHLPFIDGFVNQAPPAATCDMCLSLAITTLGACDAQVALCAAGTDCDAFLGCAQACAPTNPACVQTCRTQHAQGVADYAELIGCGCETQCPVECANDPACAVPGCGFSVEDPTCNTCIEAQCCAEFQACADDADCAVCATSPNPPATCATNELEQAMQSCMVSQCGAECGNACGFNNPPPCGDCITSCCAESLACVQDAECGACASGDLSGAPCTNNAPLAAFATCLAACPGDPCMVNAPGAGGTGGTGGTGVIGVGGTAGVSGEGGEAQGGSSVGDAGEDSAPTSPGDGGSNGNPAGAQAGDAGGCSCRTAGSRGMGTAWGVGGLAFLSLVWRRRVKASRIVPSVAAA